MKRGEGIADIEHAGRRVLAFHLRAAAAVKRGHLGPAAGDDFHRVQPEEGTQARSDLHRRRRIAQPGIHRVARG